MNGELKILTYLKGKFWDGYAMVSDPEEDSIYYTPYDNISVIDRKGRYIVRHINTFKIIPNTSLALVYKTKRGANITIGTVMSNDGVELLPYDSMLECIPYYASSDLENNGIEYGEEIKDDADFVFNTSMHHILRTGNNEYYKVIEDGIKKIDLPIRTMYPLFDSRLNICCSLNTNEYTILGENYEPISEYRFVNIDKGFYHIASSSSNVCKLVVSDNGTEKCLIYDTNTGTVLFDEPMEFKPSNDGDCDYVFAKGKDNYYVLVSSLLPGRYAEALDIYYDGEPCVGILEYEDCYPFFIVKSKSGKIGILVEENVIWCDSFCVSGEFDDKNTRKKNNILYFYNDGTWRMIKIPRHSNFYYSSVYNVYDGTFDSIDDIGSPVNIIKKNGKETFISDRHGICIYDKDRDEPEWYDKCYSVEITSDERDVDYPLYADVNGSKKEVGEIRI